MKNMTPQIPENFAKNEDGSATPLAIGFSIIFIIVGGLAVDFNKAMSERTQMQLATDSAAHAALYTREFGSKETSKEVAMSATEGMLPDAAFLGAMTEADIEFGEWDEDTGTFVSDEDAITAVRVFAELEESRGNKSKNIFLGIIGQDDFTIRTSSIYTTYFPPCFNEGFVAEGVVDVQSNNSYTDGFCIHSNTYVSINQNNYFEPGTVVSMPSLDDLDIPSSGFEKNEGLQTALRTGEYRMRLLNQLPRRFDSLRSGMPTYTEEAGVLLQDAVLYPLDLTGGGNGNKNNSDPATEDDGTAFDSSTAPRMSVTDTGKKTITPDQFLPANRIYTLNCTGNGDITFSADTFQDFVLVTNCPVKFSNGTILESVILATEGDVDASHVQLGRDDSCAPGGGAAIWTYGSVKTASALAGYGAQILALGDIQFTANADGIEGVSFISGGQIDGTSNSNMGFCDNEGTENFQRAPYFRMVN